MRESRLLTGALLSFALWATALAAGLPDYTGPYGVGTVYIEVPVADPRNISDSRLKRTGEPAFQLETVLFTLYYPIDNGTTSSEPEHPYLSGNLTAIAEGIALETNGSITAEVIENAFKGLIGNLTVPAQVDAALASKGSFPVVLFSGGDGSLIAFYSHWLGEIASRGYVTVAIDTRDGSSPATEIEVKGQPTKQLILFNNTDITPSINFTDFKARQLQMRLAEVESTIQVIQAINNGQGEAVYKNSSRDEGKTLADWNGRLDLDNLFIAGHSFGSNLALLALDGAPSDNLPIHGAITFDPGKDSGPLNTDVTVPLAILDSEEWSAIPTIFYGGTHFNVVKGIAQNSLKASKEGYFATLLGTTHASITDAALISTAFISFFSSYQPNITIDAAVALRQYVDVSAEFLSIATGGKPTGVLAEGVTYPTFRFLPNSTIQRNPWEVHVAPSGNGSGTNGTGGGYGNGTGYGGGYGNGTGGGSGGGSGSGSGSGSNPGPGQSNGAMSALSPTAITGVLSAAFAIIILQL